MNVLYEDNHIIAADKPPNLLTQPTAFTKNSLEDLLKEYIRKKYHKKGNVFLHAIHRLDKDVSGIVLFAKTSKSLSRLQKMQREKQMKKVYYAHVEGVLKKAKGTLTHFLVRKPHQSKVFSKEKEKAKVATLHYQMIKKTKEGCLIEIILITGRYHQIRSQLAFIGHPIIGDHKYGSRIVGDRIALHHGELSFIHPVTKNSVIIRSIPSILQDLFRSNDQKK